MSVENSSEYLNRILSENNERAVKLRARLAQAQVTCAMAGVLVKDPETLCDEGRGKRLVESSNY